jgi:hypothetical protein
MFLGQRSNFASFVEAADILRNNSSFRIYCCFRPLASPLSLTEYLTHLLINFKP